ncbi:hypothetical protein [Oryzibacter oryziterrae]|uniref:hypothetical protein n=1 Tax=Oryzibacter oryziterrae TaxID=2766474 RepID=UPI001F42E071|nr:hypothetical protein [Oryzibacter oryziterrae]
MHDDLMPAAGNYMAHQARREPVSSFPYTDDEVELRNRAWNFVRAPHVRDWWLDTLVEGERTRILPMLTGNGQMDASVAAMFPKFALPLLNPAYDARRYHDFLLSDAYAGSDTRWNKVIADASADTDLIPPFCAVAARVRKADIERLQVFYRQGETDAAFRANAEARVLENESTISWVWRALGYRAASYRYAIDRFEIEIPSANLFAANQAYNALVFSECHDAAPLKSVDTHHPLRSRLMQEPDPFDGPVPQK